MGVCHNPTKKFPSASNSPKGFSQTQVDFFPPPNLLRKSCQSPKILKNQSLIQCVSGIELNSILQQGGNIESNLFSFFSLQKVEISIINQTNIELLHKIKEEKKNTKQYHERKLIKEILEYYESTINDYADLLKKMEVWNQAENNFCTSILFNATEIFQVLLSFKKATNKKKNIKYWWLPPLINFSDSYTIKDCYSYLQKKIEALEKQLNILSKNVLGVEVESQQIKKFSETLSGKKECERSPKLNKNTFLRKESEGINLSEGHQAMKCNEYTLTKAPLMSK